MSSSRLVDRAPSVRHEEEVCSVSKSLATPYNIVDEVPPFFGILFTLTAATDISIQTFELDVRLEAAGSDLAIEVYTISGDYAGIGDDVNYKNESSLWTPVAQTIGVVLPIGNGIIIPSTNFTPVQMKAYSRQSFYVTMRGPYIDSTVYGLSKTGDVYAQGTDLNVLVGSGLSSYKFPAEIDPIVDPQFTGVIHYKKFGNCNSLVTSTKVEYLFLANSNSPVDISNVVDQALSNYLADNGVFGGFVQEYGVSEQGKASTDHPQFTGTCPPEWRGCPSSLVRTTVSFAHQDALESAVLLYEFYGATVAITSAVEKEVGGVEVAYVGLNSLSSGFEISLQGMPSGQTMDESTLRYFADATESFLSSIVDPAMASNFGIMVTSQEFRSPTRHVRGLQGTGTLWVTGQIHATRYAIFDASQLDLTLQNAFNSGAKNFIETLTQGSIVPGAIIAEDRSAYFANVTEIYSTVENAVLYAPGSEPTATSTPAEPNITAIAVAVGVIGGIALLVAFTFLRRFWKAQCDARRHLVEYRASRKEEAAKQRYAALLDNLTSRAPSCRSNLDEALPLSRMSSTDDLCTMSSKDELFLEGGGESSSSSQTPGLDETSSRDPPQRTRSKEMDLHAAVQRIQRKSLDKSAGASVSAAAELSRGPHHAGTSGLSSFIDRQSRGIIHNGARSVGPGILVQAERAVRAPAVENSELPRPPSGRKLRGKSFVDDDDDWQETSSCKVGYSSSVGSHRGIIRSRSFDDASAYTGETLMPWTEHHIKEPRTGQRLSEAHLAGHIMPVVSKTKPVQSAQLPRRPSGHQNGDVSLAGFPGTHSTMRSSNEAQSVGPRLLSNKRGERARADPPCQLRPRTRSFDDTRDCSALDDSRGVNPGTSLSGFLRSSPVMKSSLVAQSVDPRLLMNVRGKRRNQAEPSRRQPPRRTRSFDDTRDYAEMDECRSVDPRMFRAERSERSVAPRGQTNHPRRSHSFDDTKEYQSLDLAFESPRQPTRSRSIATKDGNAKVKEVSDRRGRSRSFDDTKDYVLEKEERSLTPIRRIVRSRSFDDTTMYANDIPRIPLGSERPIIRAGQKSLGTKLAGFMNGNSLSNSQSRQENNINRSSGIVSQPGYS